MRIRGLDHVQLAIPAGSEERARAFYAGVLGFREVEKPEPLASRGGCWFEGPGLVLHLGVEDPFAPARKAHPAFLVDDLEAWCARLTAAGAVIVPDDTLSHVRRFYAADPFGNRIEFMLDADGFSRHRRTD